MLDFVAAKQLKQALEVQKLHLFWKRKYTFSPQTKFVERVSVGLT